MGISKGIYEGYKVLKQITGEAYVFENEDQYFLVGIEKASCKDKSKIIDKVLDKIYNYGNEFFVSVIITEKENFEKIKKELGKQVIP
jgi:hypothetical protein